MRIKKTLGAIIGISTKLGPRMLELEVAKEILAELFDIRTHGVDEMIRQRMDAKIRIQFIIPQKQECEKRLWRQFSVGLPPLRHKHVATTQSIVFG